jgi:cellulose synthase/poly-beta-1,6-N-acetylglucosamine synthase-like glycosyltransferase
MLHRAEMLFQTNKTKPANMVKWILLYFPIRYIICATFFAYIGLSYIDFIRTIQSEILIDMLRLLNIPAYTVGEAFYVGAVTPSSRIILPINTEIIFLIFFPTVAITGRINLRNRTKFLAYGIACFFAFTLIQFLTIIITYGVEILSFDSFSPTIMFLTITCGSLMIELSLFSSITLPPRTKIKSIVKRTYVREYAFLTILLTSSFIFMYILLNFLEVPADSPLIAYALLSLSMTTIMTFGYFLSFFFYRGKNKNITINTNYKPSIRPTAIYYLGSYNPSLVSFLIVAHNEEKIIKRCIESIERAASRYSSGTAEIVIVNDGSSDKTSLVADEAIRNLSYCRGKLFSIPHRGKSFALQYGLKETSGDILFRIDADSVLDEGAILPIVHHFKNPDVGCVGGMLFPLEAKSMWQRTVCLMFIYYMFIVKRSQELVDSIIVQSGAFSVFRRDALLRVGGWAPDQFGEDGELTNRLARFGYRSELELKSIVYTDFPASLMEFIHQRSRWNIAFYHSRGRNLEITREFRNPRSLMFLINLISHGSGFARGLVWVYLAALAISLNLSVFEIPSFLGITKFAIIQLIIYSIQLLVFAYVLRKQKKIKYILCFPLLRALGIILSVLVRPLATETILSWSSRWKDYNNTAFQDLRKEVKRSIDPGS